MKTILLFLIFGWSRGGLYAAELITLQAYLKSELSSSAKISKESFPLDAGQKSALLAIAPGATESQFTFFYGRSAAGKIEKICSVLPQMGKEGPMAVGVCFDSNGLVTSVQILSSQEERGQKANEPSFLRQFQGKKMSDAFLVGKDIDGISGATWTSKAIAEAIRKGGFAFEKFVKGKL